MQRRAHGTDARHAASNNHRRARLSINIATDSAVIMPEAYNINEHYIAKTALTPRHKIAADKADAPSRAASAK